MYGPMFGWNGEMHLYGMLMMLVYLLVVVGIVALTTLLVVRSHLFDATDRVLDELRRRYARGEIDEKEFESLRRHLTPR